MIIRKDYYNNLIKLKDIKAIKVITGLRRSGKSVLLEQFYNYLLESGVSANNIIKINFELLEYEYLLDYKKLYEYILDNTNDGQMYILIDEIQEVDKFEKVLSSLFAKGNYDIYITGSNSHMLSSELSTLLSGRYIEMQILPFSFKEYYQVHGGNVDDAFNNYYKFGGLPYASYIDDRQTKLSYIEGIYNTVIIKDLIERKKISDVSLLKDIMKYLLDTVGNYISVKKVADTLTSNGIKTTSVTVSNYIENLLETFILYKVGRYDIRVKERLKSLDKYYVVDLGFRALTLGDRQYNVGSVLENIVFIELKRRGYSVNVGKIDDLEVDFIAVKSDEKKYIQVSASVLDPKTFEREVKPLLKIKDNYEKIILTLDKLPFNYDGVKQVNIIDWLLN